MGQCIAHKTWYETSRVLRWYRKSFNFYSKINLFKNAPRICFLFGIIFLYKIIYSTQCWSKTNRSVYLSSALSGHLIFYSTKKLNWILSRFLFTLNFTRSIPNYINRYLTLTSSRTSPRPHAFGTFLTQGRTYWNFPVNFFLKNSSSLSLLKCLNYFCGRVSDDDEFSTKGLPEPKLTPRRQGC